MPVRPRVADDRVVEQAADVYLLPFAVGVGVKVWWRTRLFFIVWSSQLLVGRVAKGTVWKKTSLPLIDPLL